MTIIRNSSVEPRIIIQANSEVQANAVDTALNRIRSTESGSSLLKEIHNHSDNTKKIKIINKPNDMNHTIPVLTDRQRNRYADRMHMSGEDDESVARELALKGKFMKGEGTSADVIYNAGFIDQSMVSYNERGERIELPQFDPIQGPHSPWGLPNNDMTLFNFLIHGMRMLKGTFTDNGTPKGTDDEETRAIGVGKYSDEPITENVFRREMHLPFRAYYVSDHVTNVNFTPSTMRPGIIQTDSVNERIR